MFKHIAVQLLGFGVVATVFLCGVPKVFSSVQLLDYCKLLPGCCMQLLRCTEWFLAHCGVVARVLGGFHAVSKVK